MSNPQWFALVGALLLFMGLTSSILKRSPLTAAIIFSPGFTVVGVTLDPNHIDEDSFAGVEPDHSVSEGSLVFKEHLERLSVVLMVLLLGGTLFRDSWSLDATGLALELAQLTLIVVTLSILLHGISIKPLMGRK